MGSSRFALLLGLLSIALLSSCSKSSTETFPSKPIFPDITSQKKDEKTALLSNGGELALHKFETPALPSEKLNGALIRLPALSGQVYFTMEGTFSERSFTTLRSRLANLSEGERNNVIKKEIEKIFLKISGANGIALSQAEEVGYFTFLMPWQPELMAPLKNLEFAHELLLTPVVLDRKSLELVRSLTPAKEGLVTRGGRVGTTGFSGLQRIRAPEFVKLAESEIGGGVKVNGDSVKLGITDTGITLNHPTFFSADRKTNRITYMKDFTREGRVYFNPGAKFEATPSKAPGATEEDLIVKAQVIATPRLPSLPLGDKMIEVEKLAIKASGDLKEILLNPASGAKLGVLIEQSLQGEGEVLDINQNGKTDDLLLMILAQDVLYLDTTGAGDFRKSKPIRDWNSSKDSVSLFAEKVGFEIGEDKLPSSDGKSEVPVRSASLVGFDPGNHGSHVAGIAAGSKTIANDAEDTLARGVSPEAKILMNRVCANNGGCNATNAIIDMALKGKAQVINMSLGGLSPFNDGYSVQETIVNRLTSLYSVMMMISAGNSGPGIQTVGSPSTARLSLSVGASASVGLIQRQYQWPSSGLIEKPEDDRDFMLFFSSRGPTAAGGFKPSLVAPGTELSAIRLNSAPGQRGGLDVYWGTSMAAPTATGAYALLLDAIQKYNLRHPDSALPYDALTLRRVLLESARPFDVHLFDPTTGSYTQGQYTWVDEGLGMLDLVAAWETVKRLRDEQLPTAVQNEGKPVALDYKVLVTMTNPRGVAYDGSRPNPGEPVFGSGLYLDYYSTETLNPVLISRSLPENLASGENAGELTRQLLSTMDEFVLKTTIYGSNKPWLKVGTLDQLDCSGSDTANLILLGKGVDIGTGEDGGAQLQPLPGSALNICVDRTATEELKPGDHGAIISAYRTVGGKTEPVASFQVPVYLRVPHKNLIGSTSYEAKGRVKSFDVSRNYVNVPKGTTWLQVSLEVPAFKNHCSGVELMALTGSNIEKPFTSRAQARVMNCDAKGRPVEAENRRKVVFTRLHPTAGVWDLHVFGSYKYGDSEYQLRVEYMAADASVKAIAGGLDALNGSFAFKLRESSIAISPSNEKSSFELDRFFAENRAIVAKGEILILEGAQGQLRAYPNGISEVTITTGGSPGNDIDLDILECAAAAETVNDPSCKPIAASGGPADTESVSFEPEDGKKYAIRVHGFEVNDPGIFTWTEAIKTTTEYGKIIVSGSAPEFTIQHSLSQDKVDSSILLNSPLFRSGGYQVAGQVLLKDHAGSLLFSVPVAITR